LQDWPHFHRSAAFEDRAAARQLHRLIDITRFDDRKATDDVLRLGVRAVDNGFLLALDDFAGAIERLAAVLQVALGVELLHPAHPLLHALLRLLGGAHRALSGGLGISVEIKKLTHWFAPFGAPSSIGVLSDV